MSKSSESTAQVQEHFRRKAFSFDHLYDEEHALQRLLRPGLFNRRELAVSVVQDYGAPSVLDVGGGSGRVGEFALEAGASRYIDVDLSDTMLGLARERLKRFGDKVELIQGDFLRAELGGPFDVVLGLGYFDYIEDAAAHVQRMGGLCTGSVVASFPRWTWTKGPIRKLRYELKNKVRIYDYTEPQLRELFADFAKVTIHAGGSGFLLRADRERP
jgi:SAM-dependent methyltransferase